MTAASDILLVEHVVTADLDDGSPVVPGFVDDGISWARVRPLPNAMTLWRRILLAETCAADHRQVAPSCISWRRATSPKVMTRKFTRKTIRRMKMDMRKYSGETFIRVIDVTDGPLQVQIAGVREGKYEKPDLVFDSGEAFSVNSTNNRILMRAYGANSEDWIGKKIELTLGQVQFQGKPQNTIIVKPISPSEKAEMNDSIPF
jgi:hypothetical protein